jgi:hypothetical protein
MKVKSLKPHWYNSKFRPKGAIYERDDLRENLHDNIYKLVKVVKEEKKPKKTKEEKFDPDTK